MDVLTRHALCREGFTGAKCRRLGRKRSRCTDALGDDPSNFLCYTLHKLDTSYDENENNHTKRRTWKGQTRDASDLPPRRRDVDSARRKQGAMTPRSFEKWREDRRENREKLEAILTQLQQRNAEQTSRLTSLAEQSEKQQGEIACLQAEKREALDRAVEAEKQCQERETKRTALVQDQQQQLSHALEETQNLQKELFESERRQEAMRLLYLNDAERVGQLEAAHARLLESFQETKREAEKTQERSDGWEEAVVALKGERDTAVRQNQSAQRELECTRNDLTRQNELLKTELEKTQSAHLLCRKEQDDCQRNMQGMSEKLQLKTVHLEEMTQLIITLRTELEHAKKECEAQSVQQQAEELHRHALMRDITALQDENAKLKLKLENA